MDTQEMYERGVADGDRGELHPFYYQHYYHYRRGYDRARRRREGPLRMRGAGRGRLLAVLLICALGIAALVVAPRLRVQPAVTAERNSTVRPAATLAPTLVRTPIFPTATALPTPVPATLRIGGMALIVTEGQALRGRESPSLKAPARASFKPGEQVRILEGPVEADGYIWWRVEGKGGSGWSAQQSPEGVVWLQPAEG